MVSRQGHSLPSFCAPEGLQGILPSLRYAAAQGFTARPCGYVQVARVPRQSYWLARRSKYLGCLWKTECGGRPHWLNEVYAGPEVWGNVLIFLLMWNRNVSPCPADYQKGTHAYWAFWELYFIYSLFQARNNWMTLDFWVLSICYIWVGFPDPLTR
jgi:hypothetical protein